MEQHRISEETCWAITGIQSCADAIPYCDSITKMPEFGVDGGNMALALACACVSS